MGGAAGQTDRFGELPRAAIERLHAAARAIRDNHPAAAEASLVEVLAAHRHHPEALRLLALLRMRQRRPAEARDLLGVALAAWPGDALLLTDLGSAQAACGDLDAATVSWQAAAEAAPGEPMPWFNLGRHLQMHGESVAAREALAHAIALMPDLVPAHVLSGDAALHLGELDAADAHYRAALALQPTCGDAWRGLSNIKTRPLPVADRARLAELLDGKEATPADRVAMGHALGNALEESGDASGAFAVLDLANGLQRRLAPWSADAFHRFLEAMLDLTRNLPAPIDPDLGEEVIFIVGMPRSGSTLFEQILAAHPDVEGGGELPDLPLLIAEESMRRRQPYPQWIPAMTAPDWQRLGRDYLARTARWRRTSPRFTDKMPDNWKFAGILRAMLPGAVVLETRRNPLETAWSCYKQQFYQQPHFGCSFGDIATYLHGCQRAMDAFRERDPSRVHLLCYEDLLAAPEARIRALLEICNLPFDPACLDFHLAQRSVRTASAAQVRQPLQRATSRTSGYGALLDPLRKALQEAAGV